MAGPGIVDIARRAGVGKSTAARALCGHGAVSARAREKVLSAARALKYRANTAARALRSGENRLLGIVVPDRASRGSLSHAIAAQKLEGIARGARRLGYDLQIFVEDFTDERAFQRLAAEKFVRGVFLLGPTPPATLELLARYGIPWIGINWRHKQRGNEPHCWTDFHHAGRTLAGHLIAQGCRRVVTFDWLSPAYGPFGEGLRAAWTQHGLPAKQLDVHCGVEFAKGPALEAALAEALDAKRPPDGVIFSLEAGMMRGYQMLRERGLEPGRDVAVATFDDLEAAAYMEPPCTAYAQPTYEMGEAAVEEMAKLLGARKPAPIARAIPGELRVRGSTLGFRSKN